MSAATRNRRPVPAGLLVVPFVLSAALVPPAFHLGRRERSLDRIDTVPQLVDHLKATRPHWRAEVSRLTRRSHCAYLSGPDCRGPLRHYPARDPAHAPRWRGLVYVEPAGGPARTVGVDGWGAYGLRVGPFLLFGDPSMLREIAEDLDGG